MDSRTAIPILIRSSSSNPARCATPSASSSALSTLSKVESRNRSTVSGTWCLFSRIRRAARSVAKSNRKNKLPESRKSRRAAPLPLFGTLPHLQNSEEGLLWNLHPADALHPLLAFLLLFQQFPLAADI